MNNENKQLVQVGNWLRDVFGIYRITVPDGSIINQKSILKNKNSENYFPPNNFLDDLYCELNDVVYTQHSIVKLLIAKSKAALSAKLK